MMEEETRGRSGNRIIALFPDLLGVGGIQVAGRLTAAALSQIAAQYGWIVDFLSLNDAFGAQMFSSNGEDIHFRGFARSKARFILAALAAARKQARVVVAVHPHLALVAAKMHLVTPRMKIAVISHGVEVWRPLSAARHKAFLKANVLAAPSRYTIEQIVRLQGVPIGRTRLLPWPLDPDFLKMADKAEVLPSLSGFPQGLVVLAIARLASDEKYKGVDHLIQAVAQLAPRIPSLYLVVAASGDDIPRHREIARELGLSDRVRFFQGLSPTEIAGCYSRCDVFALPSTGEGFGLVFLEAMAFGKPLIGAARGGITDVIEDRVNGLLVPAGDLKSLVNALAELLENESLRMELGRRGAENVRQRYSFDVFVNDLERILEEC